jgi:hypothetical protein
MFGLQLPKANLKSHFVPRNGRRSIGAARLPACQRRAGKRRADVFEDAAIHCIVVRFKDTCKLRRQVACAQTRETRELLQCRVAKAI